MKNLLTLFFMLLSIFAFSQKGNFNLSILQSIDYSKSVYTYPTGYVETNLKSQLPIGNTLSLHADWDLSDKLSFSTGLHYSKKKFYPRLNLGFFYGGINDPVDGSFMDSPYLFQHDFKLISVPLALKMKMTNLKRLHPYFKVGFTTSFRFSELESYRSIYTAQDNFEGEISTIAIKDDEFKFFSTAFDLGFGLEYAVTSRLSFVLEHNMSVWEFRAANEKFKKNDTFLFEDSILSLSNLSLGIGVQYRFDRS